MGAGHEDKWFTSMCLVYNAVIFGLVLYLSVKSLLGVNYFIERAIGPYLENIWFCFELPLVLI